MVVDVNALPESEVDYWGQLALIGELVNEEKALNNFLTQEEADKIFEPNSPVLVEYDDSDVVTGDEDLIDVEDGKPTLEKSMKLRLIDKFQKIGRK